MELFCDRPLASAAACFAAVSVAAFHLAGVYKIICALAAVVILAIAYIISAVGRGTAASFLRGRRGAAAGMCAAAILALSVSYAYMDVWYASWVERDGEVAEVRGYITDVIYKTSYSGSYRATLTELDGSPSGAGVILDTDFPADLDIGDEFYANVELRRLTVDGTFDEEKYYVPRGVVTTVCAAESGDMSIKGERRGFLISFAGLRELISTRLTVMLEGSGNGIPEALFVGDRGNLDDMLYRDLSYIGALHLLAVSGLHLTVLVGGLEAILRRFLGKKPRCIILICFTIAYMALSGFTASVTRAGVMMVLYYLSYFARRETDPVTSLFSAAALIMLVSPPSAADIGLHLSVTAMLGCLFAGELFLTDGVREFFGKIARHGILCRCISRVATWIFSSVVISLSAMLFTLPVMWLSFGRISLLSPVSTLLLTVPVTLILYLCPFLFLFFKVGAISLPLAHVCGALCGFISRTAGTLAKADGVGVRLSGGAPLAIAACAAIAVCLIAALVLSRKRAWHAFALAAIIFTATAASSAFGIQARADGVSFINYKKNDGFIVSDGGRVLICDISDGSWTPTSNAAAEADAERIGVYMLTHLHRRHIGTFDRLCQCEYVRELWLPEPEGDDERGVYPSLLEVAEKYGVTVTEYVRGETLSFGETSVVTSARTMLKRSTHPVLALAFIRDGDSTVYIGSSVHESEIYELAAEACRDADTVVFGIHGPVYKSEPDYGPGEETRVVCATEAVAEFLRKHNMTDDFSVFGE